MRKGQIAYEYLVLLGIVLALLIPIVSFSLTSSATVRAVNDGEVAISRIASAAESVYAQGIGAKQTVTVYIPEASNLPASSVSGRVIRLRVYTGEGAQYDIVRIFPFNVSGMLPQTPGYQEVSIEVLSSGTVQIGVPAGSVAICGNGVREGSEECDGSDLGGASCLTVPGGFVGGTLTCSGSCTYETSACTIGTIFYVSSATAHNGSVNNFADMQSASDGGKSATLIEQQFSGATQTLALDGDAALASGGWSSVSNTFTSDDQKATTTNDNEKFNVSVENTSSTGTITSVVVRVEQNIVGLSGNDGFDIEAFVGGTAAGSCSKVGTTADTYVECNVTSARSWTFSDINDARVRVTSTRQGASPTSWNVDHVALAINYTSSSTYATNITTDFASVTLGGTTYTLEVRYNVTSDTFFAEIYDGTAFNVREQTLGGNFTSATSATWSYVMTTAELNGGAPKIRFRDATPAGAAQGNLNIDYERIVRTG